jgi:predicted flavoprotein YhiN
MIDVAVIGGGPAGLRAAEVASEAGAAVTVFDAKASVGRKFLVAGGGGLNITKDEPAEQFAARYRGAETPGDFWARRIEEFGPAQLREWAAGLGVETFVASTKRVYPLEMKAAPLLRRWVERLRRSGARFAMRHPGRTENGRKSFRERA